MCKRGIGLYFQLTHAAIRNKKLQKKESYENWG